jgi:hypothetical protein
MKKVTLTQETKQHNVNRLHDLFIASGLAPKLVESIPTESYFSFDDAVTDQSIQNVITAYVYAAPVIPPDIKILWQNWKTAKAAATTLPQMKAALDNHLDTLLKEGFKSLLGDV